MGKSGSGVGEGAVADLHERAKERLDKEIGALMAMGEGYEGALSWGRIIRGLV